MADTVADLRMLAKALRRLVLAEMSLTLCFLKILFRRHPTRLAVTNKK